VQAKLYVKWDPFQVPPTEAVQLPVKQQRKARAVDRACHGEELTRAGHARWYFAPMPPRRTLSREQAAGWRAARPALALLTAALVIAATSSAPAAAAPAFTVEFNGSGTFTGQANVAEYSPVGVCAEPGVTISDSGHSGSPSPGGAFRSVPS